MHKLLAKFHQSEGIKQSIVTIFGNTFATGLSAIALILVTRLLSRAAYGEFSVGFAIIMIVNRLNDAGFNSAIVKFIPRSGTNDESNAIFSYVTKIKLGWGAILLLFGLFVTPMLGKLLHLEHLSILYAAFLLSACSTWYEQLLAMLQSVHRFSQAVAVNGLQSSLKMAGLITFFLIGFKNQLAIFGFYMAAPILPLLTAKWLLPNWVRLQLRRDFTNEKALLATMARHSAISLIAAGIIENIDVLFVQGYLSSSEAGLLSAISKIAMMIMLVAYSLGNVLYPRVARYHDKQNLQAYLPKAMLISASSVLGFLAFLPFARLSIIVTIGSAYLDGLPILLIMLAAAFLTIAVIPFVALFYSFKADWYFSVSGIGQLIIVLIGNGVFVPQYGLAAAAWTRVTARLFLFVFTVVAGLIIYHRKFSTEMK